MALMATTLGVTTRSWETTTRTRHTGTRHQRSPGMARMTTTAVLRMATTSAHRTTNHRAAMETLGTTSATAMAVGSRHSRAATVVRLTRRTRPLSRRAATQAPSHRTATTATTTPRRQTLAPQLRQRMWLHHRRCICSSNSSIRRCTASTCFTTAPQLRWVHVHTSRPLVPVSSLHLVAISVTVCNNNCYFLLVLCLWGQLGFTGISASHFEFIVFVNITRQVTLFCHSVNNIVSTKNAIKSTFLFLCKTLDDFSMFSVIVDVCCK